MTQPTQNDAAVTQTQPPSIAYEYETGKFWTRWLGGSMLAWPLSFIISAVIFVPILFVLGSLLQFRMFDSRFGFDSDFLMGLLISVVGGGSIGFSVGTIQQYLLKNILLWTADRWRLASTLGGIAGGLCFVLLAYLTDPYLYHMEETVAFIAMPLYVTILSAIQYLSLRVAVRAGWLWVLANLVGGVVFSGFILRNSLDAAMWGELVSTLGLWAVATLAQGAVTGYVLLFLFERMAYPYEDDSKRDTRVPAPAHAQSVWDEAI
jgi:hypothetical protein